MQRVGTNRNPALDKFGAGKHGFTAGNSQTGTPATTPGYELFDSWQEELCSVIEGMGIALDSNKRDQLLTAIQTMQRGKATVNVAGGAAVTLTAAQYNLPILILTGALTANINLVFPAISGAWIVRNQTTGAFTITCKTQAGTGVVVSQGFSNALFGDGTNIYAEQSDWLNIALTGTPTAPTAAAGTNTTQLATMAAVQQAVNGKLTKSVAGGATVTLTATEAGYAMLELTGALTANIAVVVPAASGQWIVKNATTGAYTLTVKTAAGAGIAVVQGTTQGLWCDGTNVLEADGNKADKATTLAGYGITDALTLALFTGANQSLAASGYQKLPGGLIFQWGTVASVATTGTAVTFPIAFPTSCLAVVSSCNDAAGNAVTTNNYGYSTTGFTADAGTAGYSQKYFAIGF
ncbi:hypothetical protein ACFPAG_03255 [Vogesella sp. GCM10023246]|uniref:Putative tail fiber protein gp53-like C-terminal domain-containing protein n=1 Tax=Vogesella oryzagri TaxID=3160864 RepID=A0ABV1M0S8_9NEIS